MNPPGAAEWTVMAIELSCNQFEEAVSDYTEGVLPPEMATAMRWHAHRCPACAELLEGLREALALLAEMPQVDPPPHLEAEILRRTLASREAAGWRASLRSLWHGLAQPKVALGFSMAVFAFALIINAAGINLSHVRVADLTPSQVSVTVRRNFNRTVARGVAYYNDLRVVYEIQAALHEMRQGDAPRPPDQRDRSEQNWESPESLPPSDPPAMVALFLPFSLTAAPTSGIPAKRGTRRSVKEI